jgi:hypothetical protein
MKIVGWVETQQLGFTLFNPTYGSPFSRESNRPIWEDTDNENCRLGRETQQLGFTLFNPTYGSPISRESDSPVREDTDNENCRLGRDPTVGFHFVQPNLRKPIFKGVGQSRPGRHR